LTENVSAPVGGAAHHFEGGENKTGRRGARQEGKKKKKDPNKDVRHIKTITSQPSLLERAGNTYQNRKKKRIKRKRFLKNRHTPAT